MWFVCWNYTRKFEIVVYWTFWNRMYIEVNVKIADTVTACIKCIVSHNNTNIYGHCTFVVRRQLTQYTLAEHFTVCAFNCFGNTCTLQSMFNRTTLTNFNGIIYLNMYSLFGVSLLSYMYSKKIIDSSRNQSSECIRNLKILESCRNSFRTLGNLTMQSLYTPKLVNLNNFNVLIM